MRFFILLLCVAFSACNSSKSAATDQQKFTRVENAKGKDDANSVAVDAMSSLDLTTYLRKIPGLQVQGTGPNAIVRVRGNRSAISETSPLFVVNGTILGNNFSSLYTSIDPNEIARIRVLKSASETNGYGLQGGNGVVEIKLKK